MDIVEKSDSGVFMGRDFFGIASATISERSLV